MEAYSLFKMLSCTGRGASARGVSPHSIVDMLPQSFGSDL